MVDARTAVADLREFMTQATRVDDNPRRLRAVPHATLEGALARLAELERERDACRNEAWCEEQNAKMAEMSRDTAIADLAQANAKIARVRELANRIRSQSDDVRPSLTSILLDKVCERILAALERPS